MARKRKPPPPRKWGEWMTAEEVSRVPLSRSPRKGKTATRERRPRKGPTATRWRGPEGEALADIVDGIRYADHLTTRRKKKATWEEVLREIQKLGYGVHKDPNKLKADYHTAFNYRENRSWREKLRGSDGLALVELVEDILCCDGEIDWPQALKELHPDDPRMTVGKSKARYESAVKYWTELYWPKK